MPQLRHESPSKKERKPLHLQLCIYLHNRLGNDRWPLERTHSTKQRRRQLFLYRESALFQLCPARQKPNTEMASLGRWPLPAPGSTRPPLWFGRSMNSRPSVRPTPLKESISNICNFKRLSDTLSDALHLLIPLLLVLSARTTLTTIPSSLF